MASVRINRNTQGEIISYRWRVCLGRDADGKQRWTTQTVLPLGRTPAKELKEMRARADAWEREQKAAPALNPNMLFREFINQIFWPLHVESGNLKPVPLHFIGICFRGAMSFLATKSCLQSERQMSNALSHGCASSSKATASR